MAGQGEKSALRARLLRARTAYSDTQRRDAAEAVRRHVLALPEVRSAQAVAAYVSFGSEVGTTALLDDLRTAGRRVLLPVVRPDLDLDWAAYAGADALDAGGRGPQEPRGERLGVAAVAAADVVIVPGVAADRHGHRLGRGGGSYDRALARVKAGALVAVLLYDEELVDVVPSERHDRPVDAVVTPSGVLRVDTSPESSQRG